jgi:cob(I)alamin adenosyltransferase
MYLNRLSDVFFVLARKLQSKVGVDEKQWKHERLTLLHYFGVFFKLNYY